MAYLAGGGLASLIREGGFALGVPTELCDADLGPDLNEMLALDEARERFVWSALTCSVMDSRREFCRGRVEKYPSGLGTVFGETGELGD
jgi:hypothetical protein